jgi:trehalose 6-phosphate synthase/phosphatase
LTEDEKVSLTSVLKAMNCIPIFLNPQVADNAYKGYCKEVLWPIFHNVDQVESSLAIWRIKAASKEADTSTEKGELVWNLHYNEYYAAYQTVNDTFATTLSSLVKEKDIIWVHDYHLLLLPKLLRKAKLSVSIVFFNHIPFPTSQMLRSLPSAHEILLSLTCADVVGFHTFDYARHFLNSSKRILGYGSKTLPGGLLALVVGDREVIVSMSHVSVEPNRIIAAANDNVTKKMADEIRQKHLGKKIIVGVDICQRLSGCALKLTALDQLLSDNHNMRDTIVLVQVTLRSKVRPGDEETTSSELKEMVEQINQKHGRSVIDYEERNSLTLYERMALWLSADVFLLTTLREGLNLMPLEYILAREDLPYAGVVVASEFSNCSSLLSGSLKINPFYSQHVADTLDKALSMDSIECNHRRARDIGFVKKRPSSMWTRQILKDLSQLQNMDSSVTDEFLPEQLDPAELLASYEKAAENKSICTKLSRVFVFDYGGTLLHKEKFEKHIKHNLSAISGRKPTDRMMAAVRKLSEDPRNAVIIITGLTKIKLGGLFEDMPNVSLGTSNGLLYSWGKNLLTSSEVVAIENSPDKKRAWPHLDFNIDWDMVQAIAVPIITKFTFRTNGTCLTPRVPGIGWSYFGADPEWGAKQAAQLTIELEASLANFDVTIRSQIQGSIEIVPRMLHKGALVRKFMERVMSRRAGKLPLFAVVVLDSPVDDDMCKV